MQDLIKQFHVKYGFPYNVSMSKDQDCSRILMAHVEALRGQSKAMQVLYQIDPDKDDRLWRCHLIMEELAELMEAMAQGDIIEVFHELCDLRYVSDGTGVTLGLPVDKGVEEIHRANMTKPTNYKTERLADQQSRQDTKGPDYVPPNLKKILGDYIRALSQCDPLEDHEAEGVFVCGHCLGHEAFSVYTEMNMRMAFHELFIVCPNCGPQHNLLERPNGTD